MSIQIQIRGGTTTEHLAFKGKSREITCDTTKKTIVVHDDETLGGTPLAREDMANVERDDIAARGIATNEADNFTPDGEKNLREIVLGDPVGTIAVAPLATLSGYLVCDGAAVSRAAFANLFAKIGESFGAGDGANTFNIPDYRGAFLRGLGNGSAENFAVQQADAAPNITGEFGYYMNTGYTGGNAVGNGAFSTASAYASSGTGDGGHHPNAYLTNMNASRCSATYGRGNEIRPKNFAVNFFIKY